MKIEVKLFFNFAKHLPSDSKNKTSSIFLKSGTTVQGLMDHLGLPPKVPKTILVNGIKAGIETTLQERDTVAIFPPMAGG